MKTSNIVLSVLLFGVFCLTTFACSRTAQSTASISASGESYDYESQSLNAAGFKRVDYELVITDDGKYAIMYDGDRPVTSLPLDNKCNLTNAIMWDNQ